MDKGMNFFYILSAPLGYVMEWIYKLLPNYGWDIILFTLLINLVKIPLQLSQQKSMAKMSAFQPMIMDIQTKYKDKPEKQQEEMLKLQQDYGYKPTAGCMPMLVNFLVMFGVIEVVYRPLQRIFHIGADAITAAGDYLSGGLYLLLRHLYRRGGGNEELFGVAADAFDAGAVEADMAASRMHYQLALHGADGQCPSLTAESLTAYPGLGQSVAQVVHNTDERCKKLSEI